MLLYGGIITGATPRDNNLKGSKWQEFETCGTCAMDLLVSMASSARYIAEQQK